MKTSCWIAIAAMAVLTATLTFAQAPTDAEKENARAKRYAQNFENNATVITFYDREGKSVGIAGERALYRDFSLSPDSTRVAVVKSDLANQKDDLWILDVATGETIRMTTGGGVWGPVWSPDSSQVAYVAIRNGSEAVYRRTANGEGPEEVLYKNPAFNLDLSDWSLDGRFLAFAKSDIGGGTLYVLPLIGQSERKPIEIFHSQSRLCGARFSPDGRFIAYMALQPDGQRSDIFVRPFDPTDISPAAGPWQVTDSSQSLREFPGGPAQRGRVYWGRGGKELYYRELDRSVMVVEVNTVSAFEFTKPKILFRPPGVVPVAINDISGNGDRFLAIPPKGSQLQQITVFDREGKVVNKVGEPGILRQPSFSPDGKRLAVLKTSLENGSENIWIHDIATGTGMQLTNDPEQKDPPMWSADGRRIYYVSFRGSYSGIYRRASDGTGSEELLFRYTPGAGMTLTDISPDERFLVGESGGVLLLIPMTGADPLGRKAIEFSRSEFREDAGRLSPDGRFLAYRSDENDPNKREVYVRPFDPSSDKARTQKWQVSKNGAASIPTKNGADAMLHWRSDGQEFFYRDFVTPGTIDLGVMAVDVSMAPTFQAGTPKLLFKVPGPLKENFGNISRDGQRFAFAINVPAK